MLKRHKVASIVIYQLLIYGLVNGAGGVSRWSNAVSVHNKCNLAVDAVESVPYYIFHRVRWGKDTINKYIAMGLGSALRSGFQTSQASWRIDLELFVYAATNP